MARRRRGVAGVVVAAVVACVVAGQRAPCYECEMYKDSHPDSHPYTVIRSHCVYPCECGSVPGCPLGVPVIMDGCGCCWQCARQEGDSCNGATLCDASRHLACRYNSSADPVGTCTEVRPSSCHVDNKTYSHGDSFSLDCRTQCTCQNGTYACVSLCPGEGLPPSSQCHHPHLVALPGQCCREWMCDRVPGKTVTPPECGVVRAGRWSVCSATCGRGVSSRWTTDTTTCQPVTENRLCQLRPCQAVKEAQGEPSTHQSRNHHVRRGHACKATQRRAVALRLMAGACVSARRYRPKVCGDCPNHCCTVLTSTTLTVPFLCPANTTSTTSSTTTTTTRALSVFDMMDEGQPVLDWEVTYSRQYQGGGVGGEGGGGEGVGGEGGWGGGEVGSEGEQERKEERENNYDWSRTSYRIATNHNDHHPRPTAYHNDHHHRPTAYHNDHPRPTAYNDHHPRPTTYDNDQHTMDEAEYDLQLLRDTFTTTSSSSSSTPRDLTLEDHEEEELEYSRLVDRPHVTTHMKVEWILRCKCNRSCTTPTPQPHIPGHEDTTGALQESLGPPR